MDSGRDGLEMAAPFGIVYSLGSLCGPKLIIFNARLDGSPHPMLGHFAAWREDVYALEQHDLAYVCEMLLLLQDGV